MTSHKQTAATEKDCCSLHSYYSVATYQFEIQNAKPVVPNLFWYIPPLLILKMFIPPLYQLSLTKHTDLITKHHLF